MGPVMRLMRAVETLSISAIGMVESRLQLLSLEVEEGARRLALIGLLALAAAFCVSCAVLFSALLVIVVFWDTHRQAAIAGVALCFLLVGSWLAWLVRARYRQRPKLFSLTIDELRIDRDVLQSRSP